MNHTIHRAKARARDAISRAIVRVSMWYNPDLPEALGPGDVRIMLGALAVDTRGPGYVIVYLPRWQRYSPIHRWTATRYLESNLPLGVAWDIRFGAPPVDLLGK